MMTLNNINSFVLMSILLVLLSTFISFNHAQSCTNVPNMFSSKSSFSVTVNLNGTYSIYYNIIIANPSLLVQPYTNIKYSLSLTSSNNGVNKFKVTVTNSPLCTGLLGIPTISKLVDFLPFDSCDQINNIKPNTLLLTNDELTLVGQLSTSTLIKSMVGLSITGNSFTITKGDLISFQLTITNGNNVIGCLYEQATVNNQVVNG